MKTTNTLLGQVLNRQLVKFGVKVKSEYDLNFAEL